MHEHVPIQPRCNQNSIMTTFIVYKSTYLLRVRIVIVFCFAITHGRISYKCIMPTLFEYNFSISTITSFQINDHRV